MILFGYLFKRFLWIWALVTLVFLGLLFPIDLMEQVRRYDTGDSGLSGALRLAALNLPAALYQIQPLIVMLTAITLYLGLARSSELVVIRAAGRSALRSLLAPVTATLCLGILGILLVNPIVAATQKEYERTVADLKPGGASVLSLSADGIWMRQGDGEGQTVIRASRTSLDGTVLYDALFLRFDAEGTPIERVQARRAVLDEGAWRIFGAKIWPLGNSLNPERDAEAAPETGLTSSLTVNQIRDSFGVPSAIPIFELPSFIARLDAAGFSALKHRVWLATELSNPLLLVAMVLIGAGFTMRHARQGKSGVMVLLALLVGFSIYFLRNFAQVVGENGQLPVLVVSLAPPLAGAALALGVLLHLEDG